MGKTMELVQKYANAHAAVLSSYDDTGVYGQEELDAKQSIEAELGTLLFELEKAALKAQKLLTFGRYPTGSSSDLTALRIKPREGYFFPTETT